MIVRIYMPYGAAIRFEGCSGLQENVYEKGGDLTFQYLARDASGKATDSQARATFRLSNIAGYSVEEAR